MPTTFTREDEITILICESIKAETTHLTTRYPISSNTFKQLGIDLATQNKIVRISVKKALLKGLIQKTPKRSGLEFISTIGEAAKYIAG